MEMEIQLNFRKSFAPSITALLLVTIAAGCHEVMEYQSTYSSTITFIRASDFTVENTMGGIEQGRSIIAYRDAFVIVVSADGILHRINAESMVIDTSFTIGNSSGTGYGETTVARNGHLYVNGPGSIVIDVDVMNSSVADQFIPGSMPGAFCASPVEDMIYFVDSSDHLIGEIWTGGNVLGWTTSVPEVPADMMIEPVAGRKIIVASSDESGTVYGIWLDWSSTARRLNYTAGAPCSSVEPVFGDSNFCIACPEWSEEDGFLAFVDGYVDSPEIYIESVNGHPIDICSTPDGRDLYVLSRLGSGNTLVSVFRYCDSDSITVPEFLTEIQIDGFARDFASYSEGEYILVLTSE